MTELDTIKRAKMYMEKLSQGVNPIDGTPVPEGDLTRNARMSRCFAYVAQVLDKVVTNTAARAAKTQPSAPKAAPAPSPAPAQPQPENRPNALPPELAAMLRPASSIKPAPRKQPQTEPETPAEAQPSAAAEEAPHRLPISIPYNRRADFDYSEQPIAAAEVVRRLNALADETGGRLVCTHLLDWLTDAGLLAWMPDIHNKLSRLPTQSGEEVGILLTRCADQTRDQNVLYALAAQRFIVSNLDDIIDEANYQLSLRHGPWTDEEDAQLISLRQQGLHLGEIAEQLERPVSAVRHRLLEL